MNTKVPGHSSGVISYFPPRMGEAHQWLSDMEYIRHQRANEVHIAELEEKEVRKLKRENRYLKEQLDLIMQHPLYDDRSDRINVSYAHWRRQRLQVEQLDLYRLRSRISIILAALSILALVWTWLVHRL